MTGITQRLINHIGTDNACVSVEGALTLFRSLQILSTTNAPRIIGFCGAAGAGKDTASLLLCLLGYKRMAFADALKVEVYDFIRKPTLEYAERVATELRISLIGHGWYQIQEGSVAELKPANTDDEKVAAINEVKVELRRLLQWHGTEYRRAQNPNYWIDLVRSKIKTGYWVVSDVRFRNEMHMVTEEGGEIWEIYGRDDGYTPAHASELDWKEGTIHRRFVNDGCIKDFQERLYVELMFGMKKKDFAYG